MTAITAVKLNFFDNMTYSFGSMAFPHSFHGPLNLLLAERSGAVFTKGLSQVLDLNFVQKYSQLKPGTWLRPFVNTAPGIMRR